MESKPTEFIFCGAFLSVSFREPLTEIFYLSYISSQFQGGGIGMFNSYFYESFLPDEIWMICLMLAL